MKGDLARETCDSTDDDERVLGKAESSKKEVSFFPNGKCSYIDR